MNIQVLVSTMHQKDYSLVGKMNIKTDAVIVNQSDRDEFSSFQNNGREIKWITLNERGVGRSRNTAILRSDADILLFADDDIVYFDDYEEKVLKFFRDNPKTDLAVFNFESQNPDRPEAIVDGDYILKWYNCLKFGAFRIAVRREALERANVTFSLLFGGGAKYQSGEDNLFIVRCLKNGLSGMASSIHLGTVKQEESTWFKGHTEKYFYDKGVLMKTMFGALAYPLTFILIKKHPEQYSKIGFKSAIKNAFDGMKQSKKLR
ncbi:MAG: glycosyltransferase family A protein [Clostridia bacterium]|nr:glycosyltransferase family A protein [Clostridia bacterium]